MEHMKRAIEFSWSMYLNCGCLFEAVETAMNIYELSLFESEAIYCELLERI